MRKVFSEEIGTRYKIIDGDLYEDLSESIKRSQNPVLPSIEGRLFFEGERNYDKTADDDANIF